MHGFLNLIKFLCSAGSLKAMQTGLDCGLNVVKYLGESVDSNLHVHCALLHVFI